MALTNGYFQRDGKYAERRGFTCETETSKEETLAFIPKLHRVRRSEMEGDAKHQQKRSGTPTVKPEVKNALERGDEGTTKSPVHNSMVGRLASRPGRAVRLRPAGGKVGAAR